MKRLAAIVFLSALLAGNAPSEYATVLLLEHSGFSDESLTPEMREELLTEPLIAALVAAYTRSAVATGHPAPSKRRNFKKSVMKLYEWHLLGIAARQERIRLNELVKAEEEHMRRLGDLFEMFMYEALHDYEEKNPARAADNASLAVYVLTETYVRLALFKLGYRRTRSKWETFRGLFGGDKSDELLKVFLEAAGEPLHATVAISLAPLEKFSGKGFAELVTHYQALLGASHCRELLTPRHPRGESGSHGDLDRDIRF